VQAAIQWPGVQASSCANFCKWQAVQAAGQAADTIAGQAVDTIAGQAADTIAGQAGN